MRVREFGRLTHSEHCVSSSPSRSPTNTDRLPAASGPPHRLRFCHHALAIAQDAPPGPGGHLVQGYDKPVTTPTSACPSVLASLTRAALHRRPNHWPRYRPSSVYEVMLSPPGNHQDPCRWPAVRRHVGRFCIRSDVWVAIIAIVAACSISDAPSSPRVLHSTAVQAPVTDRPTAETRHQSVELRPLPAIAAAADPQLVNLLSRCHSTVRGSEQPAPISALDSPRVPGVLSGLPGWCSLIVSTLRCRPFSRRVRPGPRQRSFQRTRRLIASRLVRVP